ncbi:4-hydroxy-tetrahydrodipicolinate reductase [Butyrivibrio sp. MC2013]|uniref:4-hydroxy-tetrahydrodipicolinate reductase n=1 Tax=Butyrivibrio sp. MC2013 TaxID=1280686 RepID=UPI0004241089|nr:4-hydroxy-tetrahydrodipicolinate reductase [Butyrivibrio sp. MC2013]
MVRVIMNGYSGRMGQVIASLAENDENVEIVAAVDVIRKEGVKIPFYSSLEEVKEEADVVIDFSTAAITDKVLDTCAEKNLPLVLCTTGLSDEQLSHMKETAGKIAILRSANMSVGVNVLMRVLKEAAATLSAAGFDMEIVEKHHNQKLDAPSGTALSLAEAINEGAGGDYEFVYDRSARREKRPHKEIGISSVRGGTIVGDHDVIFAGMDEVITFSHRAYSRGIFGKGALEAAKYLAGKAAGIYDMSDVIGG